jgi:UDP-GlcNAc:undecaprenyl-phosphate GlcNAc-1-phosphate transferase
MRSYLAAFLEALVMCLLLTPVMRALAQRVGAVSEPGERHVHTRAIPRLGGIAIALSAMAPALTLLFVDSSVAGFIRTEPSLVTGLLAGGTIMCALGALDDVRGLGVGTKLLVQVATAVFAYALGFRVDGIALPFVGPVSLGYFGLPFTVLWIVGVTNAVNLIDGLDGLAAGVVFFAAVSNLMVALLGDASVGTIFVALLMASLMGTLLGFLVYNWNPARIFMGDSGSYFLGYLLATSSIMAPLQKASTAVSLLVPVVALGLPIFDTLFSMLRRYLERRPMFAPDRGHVHHRLIDMGITHRRAVATLYGACIVLAACAVAIALGRDWEIGLGLLGACVVVVGLVRSVGQIERSRRAVSGDTQDDARALGLRAATPALLLRLSRVESQGELAECLETLRVASEVDSLCVLVEGVELVRAGSSSNAVDTVLSLPLAHDRQLELHNGTPTDIGPRVEALLSLLADEVARALDRIARKRMAQSLPEGGSGEARSPS